MKFVQVLLFFVLQILFFYWLVFLVGFIDWIIWMLRSGWLCFVVFGFLVFLCGLCSQISLLYRVLLQVLMWILDVLFGWVQFFLVFVVMVGIGVRVSKLVVKRLVIGRWVVCMNFSMNVFLNWKSFCLWKWNVVWDCKFENLLFYVMMVIFF